MNTPLPFLFLVTTPLLAQGPLTPPGAPAPTMKTLQQVEPRIDVSTLPGDASATHIISTPGSYYLTENISSGLEGSAVRIEASDVQLDLNGMTISGTTGLQLLDNSQVNIRNGFITSNDTGIKGTGNEKNTKIHNICIHANNGIILGTYDKISGHNLADSSNVVGCSSVIANGQIGIAAGTVENCQVEVIGGDSSYEGSGIYATGSVTNCSVYSDSDAIESEKNISNSFGNSFTGQGITASSGTVSHSTGEAYSSGGILAENVFNSEGISIMGGGEYGISATKKVVNSFGYSENEYAASVGIQCLGDVENSVGISDYGHGIEANGRVSNSTGSGVSWVGFESASGIVANSVFMSEGISNYGHGIKATEQVVDSVGKTFEFENGIHCDGDVRNSMGESSGGHGIYAGNAVYDSEGFSSAANGIRAEQKVVRSKGICTANPPEDPFSDYDGIGTNGDVHESHGTSTAGEGIGSGGSVYNSTGISTWDHVQGNGIIARRIVSGSSGIAQTGSGINIVPHTPGMSLVVDSLGESKTDASTVGIVCETANGSVSVGGESITNKYNMP